MKHVLITMGLILLSGCASTQWDRQKLLGPDQSVADVSVITTELNSALAMAKERPNLHVALARYADAAIASSDAACLLWMDRVSAAELNLRLGGAGLDIASGLATTAMGLASASSAVVASVGAGFTALAGAGRAFDVAVLAAPSTYTAQQTLITLLDNAALQLRGNLGASLSQVEIQLMRYRRLCSAQTIRAAVDATLQQTQTFVTPSGAMRAVRVQ